MKLVTFVCHGNICRSPMAECIFNDLIEKRKLTHKYYSISRATSREEIGSPIYPPARRILDKYNVSYSNRQAKQLTYQEYKDSHIVLCMDNRNIVNIYRLIGGSDFDKKIHKLLDFCGGGDVADPWYTGDFNVTYDDILRGCNALIDYLEKE